MFPSTNKSEFGHNLDLLKEPTPPKKKNTNRFPNNGCSAGKKIQPNHLQQIQDDIIVDVPIKTCIYHHLPKNFP
jgi:hypothetical protein